MKTIKVYTSKKDSKTKLELHFNLWNSTKNKLKSLDIGVMAPIEDNVYDVILTIPGKYEEKDIQDLGKILIQKQAVANNVFNCNINKIGTGNDFRISVTKDNNFNFIIQQFIPRFKDNDEDKDGQEKQNCFINDAKITIHLKIQKDENYKSEFIYFRLRLNNFSIESFTTKTSLKSKIFDSHYDENSIIDFRVNDLKLLPLDEGQNLQANQTIFSKVHFLYITDINENIILTDKNMKSKLRYLVNTKFLQV